MSDRASQRASELWSAGSRWDEVLAALRSEGFSKTASIRASVEVLRLPLADAKRLVHGSAAWRDVRSADERWQQELVGELRAEMVPPER